MTQISRSPVAIIVLVLLATLAGGCGGGGGGSAMRPEAGGGPHNPAATLVRARFKIKFNERLTRNCISRLAINPNAIWACI